MSDEAKRLVARYASALAQDAGSNVYMTGGAASSEAHDALLAYIARLELERDTLKIDLEKRIAALEAENAKLRVNAERYEAIKRDVTDGELIVCYTGDDGGDIGGPECIDDWCDASIDAARGEQT
jgi:hypothetical protein